MAADPELKACNSIRDVVVVISSDNQAASNLVAVLFNEVEAEANEAGAEAKVVETPATLEARNHLMRAIVLSITDTSPQSTLAMTCLTLAMHRRLGALETFRIVAELGQ